MDRDGPDSDLISRFERLEQTLEVMGDEGDIDAWRMGSGLGLQQLRRQAFINAMMDEGDERLVLIAKAYPDLDIVALAERLRIRAVIERLS